MSSSSALRLVQTVTERSRPVAGSQAENSIRILFVFACLTDGGGEADARLLARRLDPRRYRIDAVACFRKDGMPELAHAGLEALCVDVDRTPYRLSFEDTVDYLASKLAAYDIVVSCQNVADVYPALERLKWRPALIEHGGLVAEALSGPKHFTNRYVASDRSVRDAAASRMPGREAHALEISSTGGLAEDAIVQRWQAAFDAVIGERQPAPSPSIFDSFIQGGFECATQRRKDGTRLDLTASTLHDGLAGEDYAQLRDIGIRTVRDGLRWHRIEATAHNFEFSSFLPMLRAARSTGSQVIWDLMHYGWPDHLDIWSPAFADRFALFARAVAYVVRSESDAVPFYCPVNEISYHSWAGGDVAYFNPMATRRGFELKVQLARASIAAMDAILDVDPRARFVHCEPTVHVVAGSADPVRRADAEGLRQAQFQAFDMIAGRLWPQLGGSPELLDIVGVNFYPHNQWIAGIDQMEPDSLGAGDPDYRPFRSLLTEVYARYGRPMLVAETGAEGDTRADWFRTVQTEVAAARRVGVPVEGICLYPIIDHPGWDDDRECPSGLFGTGFEGGRRSVHAPLAAAIATAHAPA